MIGTMSQGWINQVHAFLSGGHSLGCGVQEREREKEGFLLVVRAGLLRQWNLSPESGPLRSSYCLRTLRNELASVFSAISHWTVLSSRSGFLITLFIIQVICFHCKKE